MPEFGLDWASDSKGYSTELGADLIPSFVNKKLQRNTNNILKVNRPVNKFSQARVTQSLQNRVPRYILGTKVRHLASAQLPRLVLKKVYCKTTEI
jgi:hypothetical protein